MYECETIREGTEELNLTTEFNKALFLRSELGTFELTSNIMQSTKRAGREVESVHNLEIKVSSLLVVRILHSKILTAKSSRCPTLEDYNIFHIKFT